jgi:hypothetical protein
MKTFLYLLIVAQLPLAANAENFLPKESCATSANESECRNVSHAVTAVGVSTGAANSVLSYNAFSRADQILMQNTVERYTGSPAIVSDNMVTGLSSDIQHESAITFKYYLNPEENKELHISNQKSHISSLESDARNHDANAVNALNRQKAIYKEVQVIDRDASGKVISTSTKQEFSHYVADPDYATYASETSAASDVRQRKIPAAERELAQIRNTDPSKLKLLARNSSLSANATASNVKDFLQRMKDSQYKIIRMTQVKGFAVRAARRMGVKGMGSAAIAVLSIGLAGYEAYSGQAGKAIQDGKDDALEMINVSQ